MTNIKEHQITSVIEYLQVIKDFDEVHISQWMFRGVKSSFYSLIPTLFRLNLPPFIDWTSYERYLLDSFMSEGAPHFKTPITEKIDLMVIAQHYGLPTRLLDWTIKPLVALFFATENHQIKTEDSAVWCFGFPSTNNCWGEATRMDIRRDLAKICSDYQGESPIIFPKHLSPRIISQGGCFTLHDFPESTNEFIPFEQSQELYGCLEKIVIPASDKLKIQNELFDLGVTYSYIFPDLDGISKKLIFESSVMKSRNHNLDQISRMLERNNDEQ